MRTYSKDTKNVATGFIISIFMVVSVALVGATAEATPPQPDKEDLQNLEDVKENQRGILEREEWNRAEVTVLNKKGWNIQWSSDPDAISIIPLVK